MKEYTFDIDYPMRHCQLPGFVREPDASTPT